MCPWGAPGRRGGPIPGWDRGGWDTGGRAGDMTSSRHTGTGCQDGTRHTRVDTGSLVSSNEISSSEVATRRLGKVRQRLPLACSL